MVRRSEKAPALNETDVEIWRYVYETMSRGRSAPTRQEIADYMGGMSKSSVQASLKKLEAHGKIGIQQYRPAGLYIKVAPPT